MDPSKKWEEIEQERRYGFHPPPDPTFQQPLQVTRIRKEYNARDQVNSRQWDFFHATPPTITSSEEVKQHDGNPIYMDMNLIPTRINAVQYRVQPEYIPDTKSGQYSVPPPFSQNAYTQRLDSEGSDARNMIRELRGAIHENNTENQIEADRLLTERQFSDRWLSPKAAVDIQSLQAYELLRPKHNDWRDS